MLKYFRSSVIFPTSLVKWQKMCWIINYTFPDYLPKCNCIHIGSSIHFVILPGPICYRCTRWKRCFSLLLVNFFSFLAFFLKQRDNSIASFWLSTYVWLVNNMIHSYFHIRFFFGSADVLKLRFISIMLINYHLARTISYCAPRRLIYSSIHFRQIDFDTLICQQNFVFFFAFSAHVSRFFFQSIQQQSN